MHNYYFTFGTDPRYPFGIDDYVKVTAPDLRSAIQIYRDHHPDRPGSHLVNCAFYYDEDEFLPMIDKYYHGADPIEVLTAPEPPRLQELRKGQNFSLCGQALHLAMDDGETVALQDIREGTWYFVAREWLTEALEGAGYRLAEP